jgi:hypothetical protein
MYRKDKNIAFVLVPKCGSTSLRHALNWAGFSPLTGFEKPSLLDSYHITYNDCIEKYPNLKSYKTYGVFRDPLDRFVSAMNYAESRNLRLHKNMTFFRPQVQWLDAPNMAVIEFENFEQGVKDALSEIDGPASVLHLNRSGKPGAYKVNDEVVQFVRDKYAVDYEFAKNALGKEY